MFWATTRSGYYAWTSRIYPVTRKENIQPCASSWMSTPRTYEPDGYHMTTLQARKKFEESLFGTLT